MEVREGEERATVGGLTHARQFRGCVLVDKGRVICSQRRFGLGVLVQVRVEDLAAKSNLVVPIDQSVLQEIRTNTTLWTTRTREGLDLNGFGLAMPVDDEGGDPNVALLPFGRPGSAATAGALVDLEGSGKHPGRG